MPNVINYAEEWKSELLATVIQGTLCSPFITTNVIWLNAKTFHFTQMSTSGYKSHSRNGGWNRGTVDQVDVPFTLYHDRDIEFLIDKLDVDESNATSSIQNISEKFIELEANPEMDAEFFSKVATVAIAEDLYSQTPISSWDTTNVFPRLKAMMKAPALRLYKQRGSLLGYIDSAIMDLLEQSKDFVRKIEMTALSDAGIGLQTRVTSIDGVTLVEVIANERFHSEFDFTDGFTPEVGSFPINVMFASLEMVKKVPKISSIYFFAPGAHTEGDGYLYQNRAFGGTFVFPNGKDNSIDSIFVDLDDGAPITVTSVEGTASGDTLINVLDTLYTGNTWRYKTGAAITLPAYGVTVPAGYLAFTNDTDYTATTGEDFAVIEVTPTGEVVRSGKVVVVSLA